MENTGTGIGWTGKTNNIAKGCSKVNDLCKNCYMFRDLEGRFHQDGGVVIRTKDKTFFKPLHNKIPTVYFACSLTDFFHPQIDSYRQEAWDMYEKANHHIYQILTKRAGRIKNNLPTDWYENTEKWKHVWLGTSIGGDESDRVMVKRLMENTASVLFLSIEPLIGSVQQALLDFIEAPTTAQKWVIVGGESGNGNIVNDPNVNYPYRECREEWIAEVVNTCNEFGVPCFVKQLGCDLAKKLKAKTRTGKLLSDLPYSFQVRQMPINVSGYICNSNF